MRRRPLGNSVPVAINRYINSAYDNVLLVAENIKAVNTAAENIEFLSSYLGAFEDGAIPTERPDGSPLETGDFYYSDKATYYYNADDDTWTEFNPEELLTASANAVDAAARAEEARDVAVDAEQKAYTLVGGTDIGDYEDDPTFNNITDYVVFGRGTSEIALFKVEENVDLPYTVDSTTNPHPTDDDNLRAYTSTATMYTYEETTYLTDGQVVVDATSELKNYVVYLWDSASGERERLDVVYDYTTNNSNQIVLTDTYPVGSIVTIVFEDIGQSSDTYLKKQEAEQKYGDHNKQANRGSANSHPASAISTTSGESVQTMVETIKGKNELTNANFLIPSPDDITHPSSTATTYNAGTQIFSGVYAGEDGCTITYVNGQVTCTQGSYEYRVPSANGLEYVPVFSSSVADYDGLPRRVGVSHALVNDEYVVTVLPEAGSVFSVKFEQGDIATRHIFKGLVDIYPTTQSGSINLKSIAPLGDGDDWSGVFSTLVKGDYYLPDGVYVVNNVDLPKEVNLFLAPFARLRCESGVSAIRGVVTASNSPVEYGLGRIDVHGYDISVDLLGSGDFTSIQDACNFIPSPQWQRFNMHIADGQYDEDVYLDNKWASGSTIGQVTGERTGVYITGETKSGCRVKSWMVSSCGGSAFNPMIARQTVFSHGVKTNEKASIEFYGCPSGAVLDVDFHSEESDSSKGIQAYDSVISVEDVDFGDQLYTDLFVSKHGAKLNSNSNTRLGIGTSPKGVAKRYVSNPIGGEILFSDMSGLSTAGDTRVRRGGAMNGFTYDTASRAFYGPALLDGVVSAYHTYFTSESEFVKAESLDDSSVTIDPIRGLNLHCGSLPNAFGQALLRRLNTISTQDILRQQQLIAAVQFPSMSGAFFELGIGFGNGRIYFEVGSSVVKGVFVDFSGASTSVDICDTADITGDDCTFNLSVERDNTTASTQLANVRFVITTKTFEVYKELKPISGSTTNTYQWYTKLESVDGTQQDVYIGELRLYRE